MNKLARTMMALAMTTTMLTGCGGKTGCQSFEPDGLYP